MKITNLILTVGLTLACPVYSFACSFDTDCDIGSRCSKPNGSLEGWCVNKMNPDTQNARNPAHDPLKKTGKTGNICSFDLDCGIGGKCVKEKGIKGTCL